MLIVESLEVVCHSDCWSHGKELLLDVKIPRDEAIVLERWLECRPSLVTLGMAKHDTKGV